MIVSKRRGSSNGPRGPPAFVVCYCRRYPRCDGSIRTASRQFCPFRAGANRSLSDRIGRVPECSSETASYVAGDDGVGKTGAKRFESVWPLIGAHAYLDAQKWRLSDMIRLRIDEGRPYPLGLPDTRNCSDCRIRGVGEKTPQAQGACLRRSMTTVLAFYLLVRGPIEGKGGGGPKGGSREA